jgi:TolA-binding protein
MENETRSTEERRVADVARQAQLKKIEELQNRTEVETANTPVKAPEPALPANNPPSAASVQTISVTTDREQTLYRSAVTAYKIGDCTESVKAFDAFSKAYPSSPFSSDAAYYRKDCVDRLATSSSSAR